MNFGDYIARQRIDLQLSQRQLAVMTGISNSTISRIEKGLVSPDSKTMAKLSIALNIPGIDLLRIADGDIPAIKTVKIPVLGVVPAGIPVEAIEDIIDYEEISEKMAHTGDFFALQIKGDSMEPRIKEGDIVIIRQQKDVDSGKVAVVLIGNSETTVKQLFKHADGISLLPFNQTYPPLFYTWKEVDELPLTVIGQVMELRGKFF